MPKSFLTIVLTCTFFGCAHSSRNMYGTTARYSYDERAWMAGTKERRWLFRNPLSGCVLRCRSDVERWSWVNAALSHAKNKDDGAPLTALAATFPIAIPGMILLLPAYGLSEALKAPSARSRRAQAEEARKKGALEEAANLYAMAVATGDNSAGEPLAQVLVQLGHESEAVRARSMMVCSGADLGDAGWQRVESWLQEHGRTLPECSDTSTQPIAISWED